MEVSTYHVCVKTNYIDTSLSGENPLRFRLSIITFAYGGGGTVSSVNSEPPRLKDGDILVIQDISEELELLLKLHDNIIRISPAHYQQNLDVRFHHFDINVSDAVMDKLYKTRYRYTHE